MKTIYITALITSLLGGSIIAPTPALSACIQIFDEDGNWINEQEYTECIVNESGIALYGLEKPDID